MTPGLTTIELIRGATTLTLSSQDGPYTRTAESGLGPAPLTWLTERGPFQDGVTTVGYRLQQRQIGLALMVSGEDEADYLSNLDALLRLLQPRVTPLQLRYTRLDGKVRQFDVRPGTQLPMPSSDQNALVRKLAIELIADDPTCYDPVGKALSLGVATGGGSFLVPLTVPVGVGTSVINQSVPVTYVGRHKTHPALRITGPVTDLVIQNLTIGEKLDFCGTTLIAGTEYRIDLRYGYKTITDQNGNNQIAALTNDSDLGTWHLAPDPDALDGINSIQVTGTGANSATQVYMTYNDRYLHI